MPLKSPNLDDRKYEDLLAEAKKLIPAFNPEWTDHNDSDPGITMLQLFSWLGDQIIYRLNRVPDKNYVEFLRLAGVRLRAAAPARTTLTFKLNEGASPTWIPKGTQVDAEAGGEEPLTFETLVDLQAAEAQLTAVAVGPEDALHLLAQPTEPMPVGTAPDGAAFQPLGAAPADGSALYLGFDQALPRGLEFRLRFLVPESSGASGRAPAWVGPPKPATRAPGQITWEWLGADGWHVLDQVLDTTVGFLAEGEVRFKVPGQMAADDLGFNELAEAEDGPPFWLRGWVTAPEYETAPRLRAVLWNAVPAAHAATMSEETLGRATGEPDQTHTLAYKPVLAGFLRLRAEENGELVDWTEVPDLLASGPTDRHYTLDSATGEIRGGDGVNGRIWPLNAAIVAVAYARGGGKAGNVAAGTITSLRTTLSDVESVTNPFPATGGDDVETLASAMARAPRELRTMQRAVTESDYEAHALATPGGRVARARVLPLTHPDFPGVRYPGAVTVVVVPTAETAKPYPSRTTLDEVRAYLETVRTVTTEVYVRPPVYREVVAEADVTVQPGHDPGVVRDACLAALKTFFHALTGGPDGTGWPWGGAIYYSDAFALLQRTDGVNRVTRLTIAVDGQPGGVCADVALNDGDLVYSGEHKVSVSV